MRLAWLTDIHLNFLNAPGRERFLDAVRGVGADAVLLGGDIGESDTVVPYLQRMAGHLPCPIYFVLGNHDFYDGSLRKVRSEVRRLCRRVRNLRWLSESDAVTLTEETALAGHDGWADARLGDFDRSTVMLNDYLLIDELAGISRKERRRRLRALGAEAAAAVRRTLPAALDARPHTVFLTHVPPFREAAWHEGRPSDADWAPHFACGAVGDVLRELMASRPDRRLTVLCGHTHGGGETKILPNLTVLTGAAEYGRPVVQRMFDV
jgi:predicted MPP superfamily phosphohydrolase